VSTPEGVRIRSAVESDAAVIARTILKLAEATGETHKVKSRASDFARHGFGPRPAFLGLLAEHEAHPEPVGLALWFYNFSSWRGDLGAYLQDLWVDEALRGSGLGRGLLAESARRAKADGATHLRLSVATDNSAARAFYARLGFTYRDDECIYQVADETFERLAALS